VDSFVVQASTGGAVFSTTTVPDGAATSTVITGLTNGLPFTFKVAAVNAIGTGAQSAASNVVTPSGPVATVPAAPAIGTAASGNTQATVNWTAPANGGSAITGYQVEVQTSTGTVVAPLRPAAAGATSLVVTGLTNGTSYRFRVRATNIVGSGLFSALSTAVTPAAAPATPLTPTATAGNASALVTFTAPGNGGSAITGFSVRVVNAATLAQVGALRPAAAGATSLNVTGLVNGTAVRFQVQATNAAGTGAFSALSAAVTPRTVPGAPLIGTPTRGNASALVRWTAPDNGGSAITGYSVRVANAATNAQIGVLRPAAAGTTSLTVTGLVNGTAYSFQVRATNAVGTGAFSALSIAVTPATAPGTPGIGTASSGVVGGAITALARWTTPAANGGAFINGYVVTALRMNAAGAVVGTVALTVNSGTATSATLVLPAGNYRFVVRARNAVGLGANSARSNLVTAR
jgi:titin